jgi:hypothetical protein
MKMPLPSGEGFSMKNIGDRCKACLVADYGLPGVGSAGLA